MTSFWDYVGIGFATGLGVTLATPIAQWIYSNIREHYKKLIFK
jgi:hypothetical protein